MIFGFPFTAPSPPLTMVSSFPISEAQLVALFAEGVAYGMHAVTFTICMWTWVHRSKASRSARSWPWMSIAIALFIVGTLDVSFNLYHNIVAFCLYTGPGGAEGDFKKLNNWVNVLRVSRNATPIFYFHSFSSRAYGPVRARCSPTPLS